MKNCGIVVKKKAVNTVVIPYLKGIETLPEDNKLYRRDSE